MTHTCAAIVILSWCYLSNGFSYHFNKNLRLSARSASKINCDEPITVEALSEDEILKLVNGTDSGIKANDNIVKTVDEWIAAASKTFNETNYPSTALESPFLVGNYEVSFVGTSKTQSSSGNPAGGGYRGVLGRFIYKNEGLYQHIIRENKNGSNSPVGVINYITGRVLGLFTLSVILKGVVEAVSREEREGLTARYGTPLTAGTVRAKFGSPLLGLGWRGRGTGKKTRLLGALSVGPSSEVVLDTPSVSPTLRTGRGSRGSTFLFARTSSPAAEGYRAVLETAPVVGERAGRRLLGMGVSTFLIAHLSSFLTISQFASSQIQTVISYLVRYRMLEGVQRASQILCWPLMFTGILLLFSKGGIINE